MKSFKSILLEQLEENQDKIVIKKSETADTRTCDWSKVSPEQLLRSSKSHIDDVKKGLKYFSNQLTLAGEKHDHDKISDIEGFHEFFSTGFKSENWYKTHKKVNRHHVADSDGVPKDVNLVDVIEYVVDCIMAGVARSGHVYTLELPNELLQQAFQNTVTKLKEVVELEENY